jgi:hypothetical protein
MAAAILAAPLHREIRWFLLLTRQAEIAVALFSVLFLPGVLLHETSHYLMGACWASRLDAFRSFPRQWKMAAAAWLH